jgi:hypothetical protein
MRIDKFTFEYKETRSHSYQSAAAGVVVEVTLEEGESYEQAFTNVRKLVHAQVSKTAEQSLNLLLDNKRQDI